MKTGIEKDEALTRLVKFAVTVFGGNATNIVYDIGRLDVEKLVNDYRRGRTQGTEIKLLLCKAYREDVIDGGWFKRMFKAAYECHPFPVYGLTDKEYELTGLPPA